jgi:hypothetical protein
LFADSIKVLEDGDLQTIGLEDYEQKLKHPFTAHPKIDPITGIYTKHQCVTYLLVKESSSQFTILVFSENKNLFQRDGQLRDIIWCWFPFFYVLDVSGEMFIFTYQMLAPHLIYRVVSKDGVVKEPVPITMPGPVMMHDFAISENYAIFMDLPLLLDPLVHAQSGIHHCPLSLYILQLNEGLNYWYWPIDILKSELTFSPGNWGPNFVQYHYFRVWQQVDSFSSLIRAKNHGWDSFHEMRPMGLKSAGLKFPHVSSLVRYCDLLWFWKILIFIIIKIIIIIIIITYCITFKNSFIFFCWNKRVTLDWGVHVVFCNSVNAWEEGDEVILTGCRKDGIDLNPDPEFKTEKAWRLVMWSTDNSQTYVQSSPGSTQSTLAGEDMWFIDLQKSPSMLVNVTWMH